MSTTNFFPDHIHEWVDSKIDVAADYIANQQRGEGAESRGNFISRLARSTIGSLSFNTQKTIHKYNIRALIFNVGTAAAIAFGVSAVAGILFGSISLTYIALASLGYLARKLMDENQLSDRRWTSQAFNGMHDAEELRWGPFKRTIDS